MTDNGSEALARLGVFVGERKTHRSTSGQIRSQTSSYFEHGRLTDMAAFEQPSMFTAFGLPASL